jgi:hypothetical protein
VCCVYDIQLSQINIFINGIQVISGSSNIWNSLNNPTTIGGFFGACSPPNGENFFSGKIDDIGVWNRALTQQEITALYSGSGCTYYDTVTTHISVYDTTYVTVYDTITTTINDTITTYLSVNDTLKINVNITGVPQPNNTNLVTIYPNPAKDHLLVNLGNYTSMNGYTVKITNALGQIVFNQPVNQQQFYIDLSTWGGAGTYILYITDQNQTVKSQKQIVLQ